MSTLGYIPSCLSRACHFTTAVSRYQQTPLVSLCILPPPFLSLYPFLSCETCNNFTSYRLNSTVLCWASSSSAQECPNCEASCSEASTNELCCNAQCCVWDDPPIDTSEQSLSDPKGTPLGFTTAAMPREESDDPMPCVVVNISEPNRQTYIQLLIDSKENIW